MNVTVFDYGAGNLHSLVKALELCNATVRVETSPVEAVRDTDALVLPGVGAFAPAAERLAPGLEAMRDAIVGGLPCLGICLGMQLLFDRSDEGPGRGLGILAGHVGKLTAARIPQIGWNTISTVGVADSLLLQSELDVAYYANSFVCRPARAHVGHVVAWSEHGGDTFAAVVRRYRTVGTQFHPEKSSTNGIRFLNAFLTEASPYRANTIEAPT